MPTHPIGFSVDTHDDQDILDWCDTIPSGRLSAEIRKAIREYMAKTATHYVMMEEVWKVVVQQKNVVKMEIREVDSGWDLERETENNLRGLGV